MFFGALAMKQGVRWSWTAQETHARSGARHLSVELFQVSVFLAAFSGLYFTVSAVTDEAYREQFFTEVMRELERAVGVRAVYLALREPALPTIRLRRARCTPRGDRRRVVGGAVRRRGPARPSPRSCRARPGRRC